MKVLKSNVSGLYFVEGRGFSARLKADATRIDPEEVAEVQNCATAMGLGYSTIECAQDEVANRNIRQNADGSSFAPNYIRQKDVRYGQVQQNKLNPSKRRFATEAEAEAHAKRFKRIEGHIGYYVTKVYEPVNAYVNQVTGKTNPVIGRGRTNRA